MQDLVENLRRGSEGIDLRHQLRGVILEQRGSVLFVDCQPLANQAFIGIICTPILYRALAKPLHQLFDIIADQVHDPDHRDPLVQQVSLPDCSRDAIQDE